MGDNTDLIAQLSKASGCRRCHCRDCGREGFGENHDHVCTDGIDCVETREKLRASNSGLRVLCSQAATALRSAERERDSERQARENSEFMLRCKDAAMEVLFKRMREAGVDYSDLIP